MFKKGHVWCNAKGKMICVIGSEGDSVFIRMLNGPKLGYRGWVKQATVINSYKLVGNNYQERATEPARPGTAFKRWLGEMTSGIPKQRGCRKEDC